MSFDDYYTWWVNEGYTISSTEAEVKEEEGGVIKRAVPYFIFPAPDQSPHDDM